MQRREPHIVHFQEFENLERDCHALLSSGNMTSCIGKFKKFLERRNQRDVLKTLNNVEFRFRQNEDSYRINKVIDTAAYNIERNSLHSALIELINNCVPPNFDDYQRLSLRRHSKWDEQKNLTVYLQFDRDFRFLRQIIKDLANSLEWKPRVPLIQYFMESTDKATWVLLPDDFEDGDLPQDEKDKLSEKEPLSDDQTVRLKEIVIEEMSDEYDKVQTKTFVAEAIVEIQEEDFQLNISATGDRHLKCKLVNEVIEWLDHYVKTHKYEPFSICIPQAVGFRAIEEESSEKVLISMKQTI